jgi:hypothetical protein
MKRRENLPGARRSLFELNEACQESERDRVFFRNILRIITSKVVHILENCDKRQKVYGKIRSSDIAKNYAPCSSQMKKEFQ